MIKRPWMDLKLGKPSRFGPISSLKFGKWDPRNIGHPYSTYRRSFFELMSYSVCCTSANRLATLLLDFNFLLVKKCQDVLCSFRASWSFWNLCGNRGSLRNKECSLFDYYYWTILNWAMQTTTIFCRVAVGGTDKNLIYMLINQKMQRSSKWAMYAV